MRIIYTASIALLALVLGGPAQAATTLLLNRFFSRNLLSGQRM